MNLEEETATKEERDATKERKWRNIYADEEKEEEEGSGDLEVHKIKRKRRRWHRKVKKTKK